MPEELLVRDQSDHCDLQIAVARFERASSFAELVVTAGAVDAAAAVAVADPSEQHCLAVMRAGL